LRLIPSDPDLATIVGRIKDGSLDLQPDFQRGAVWPRSKQRLLVDSVLRNWYVPPVHVVRTREDFQVVLDGQQRLRALNDFVNGVFPADGATDPYSREIDKLGGLRYGELPERVARRFDRFTIRVFELIDYAPEEPYELFFRLNQPTTLTAAEKRNAFFGNARAQIKELTAYAEANGMSPERIGFSNARLAYEDVVSRFVWTLEARSLIAKVTASRVTSRYREPQPFADSLLSVAQESLRTVFGTPALDEEELRLNKAMAHSWLLFVARARYLKTPLSEFDKFLYWVESTRTRRRHTHEPPDGVDDGVARLLFLTLNDRASARVNDVSSVVLRDAVLWVLFASRAKGKLPPEVNRLARAVAGAKSPPEAENRLAAMAQKVRWEKLQ
jgi:hypothetical protein